MVAAGPCAGGPQSAPVRATLRFLAGSTLAGAAAAQTTPAPAPAPQQVQITGGRESETEQRRQSTASKIVIGREEIDKFGDASLGEVLRRLPGVTTPGAPGRGGPPRLRGLGGGYTQILIDGQRMPPGFSLESLTPDQVERIEILRAPTAETGARAIAGTINVVLREGMRRRANEVRVGASVEDGTWGGGTQWTRTDSVDDLGYTLSASLFNNLRRDDGRTETVRTGAGAKTELESFGSLGRRQGLHLSGRLQWRLGETGDSLTLSPSLFAMENESERRFTLLPPSRYDGGETDSASRFANARLNLQWRQRLSPDVRMELNANAGAARSASDSRRVESRDTGDRLLEESALGREQTLSTSVKFTRSAGAEAEHSLVGGLEAEAVQRRDQRSTQDSLAALDPALALPQHASSVRTAAYLQDEWTLNPSWSVHGGLRWEQITTRGAADETGTRPQNTSRVTSPLVHLLWKPDPKARDQVRLSLTRSYRAPSLEALIARPRISARFSAAEPNDPTSPDTVGNPGLRPELATGIDLAFERYLQGGGLLSANLFHRRIRDLMRSVTGATPEDVPWSDQPRYVARQQNVGSATTQGLELEAKFGLDQLVADAPRVELRANLSLFRSRVDGVPGPDNRLSEQPRASGNLGADWRVRGTPVSVGGNLNWVPAYETQLAEDQRTATGTRRVADAYLLWTFDPATALRVMASNLAPREYETRNTITTATFVETARTLNQGATNWQVRLELKL